MNSNHEFCTCPGATPPPVSSSLRRGGAGWWRLSISPQARLPALDHRKELCVSALSLGLICNSGQTGKIPLNFLLDSQQQVTVVISDGGDATQCVQKVVAALAGVVRGLPHQSGSAETEADRGAEERLLPPKEKSEGPEVGRDRDAGGGEGGQ